MNKSVAKPKQPEEQRLLGISSLSELTKHVIAALNFVSVVAAIKIKVRSLLCMQKRAQSV
jgi:hypothetical protein